MISIEECSVNINADLPTPQPLYFHSNTTDFVTTTPGTSAFHLDADEKIDLFCSTGFRPPYGNETLVATCIGGNQFQINNKSVHLIDAVCKNYPNHTARVSTNRKCSVGNIVEIGFQAGGKQQIISIILSSET